MNKYRLPTSINIDGVECEFNSDYRDILHIFEALNDPDLLDEEKTMVALQLFYKDDKYRINLFTAIKEMYSFMTMSQVEDDTPTKQSKPLYDWEQDFNIIVAPINRVLGTDVRGLEYLHWWTFLSGFMEIGECTFNTYVGIRDKLNHNKKLDKHEKRILDENRSAIILKKKYDSTTQALMDEIMGKEG